MTRLDDWIGLLEGAVKVRQREEYHFLLLGLADWLEERSLPLSLGVRLLADNRRAPQYTPPLGGHWDYHWVWLEGKMERREDLLPSEVFNLLKADNRSMHRWYSTFEKALMDAARAFEETRR